MSTRSGRRYKISEDTMTTVNEDREPLGGDATVEREADRLSAIIESLVEERRVRDAQIAEERAQREREFERQRLQREEEMQQKIEMMMRLVQNVGKSKLSTPAGESAVKVAKLTEDDDIEGYLMTFERQMAAYEIDKKRWAYLLAPKLSAKAQQAYMAIDNEDVGD